jgi:hypothetical protein
MLRVFSASVFVLLLAATACTAPGTAIIFSTFVPANFAIIKQSYSPPMPQLPVWVRRSLWPRIALDPARGWKTGFAGF